jgi:protein arginine N-methyltransferase 1
MSPEILELAKRRMVSAGYSSRFVPIQDVSFSVTLERRVDVLVSEIIGNLADNENFVPILRDATHRLLCPGGIQIPGRVVSYLAPVEARIAYQQIAMGSWHAMGGDSGMGRPAVPHPEHSPFDLYYDAILPLSGYLAEPKELRCYSGSWLEPPTYLVQRDWQIQRTGLLTGFKGFFVADLADGTVLDISGDDRDGRVSSDSWKHAYLPIQTPIEAEAGDVLQLEFSRDVTEPGRQWGRQCYTWSGHVKRQGRLAGEFFQTTRHHST